MNLLREDPQTCLRANLAFLVKHSIIYQRNRGCLVWQLYTTSLTQLTDFARVYSAPTAVAQWLRCCATNRKVAVSIPAGVSTFFIDIKSFPSQYGPGGRLSLQQKWVPGLFPGGKNGRCVRLTTYHHPVPLSRNLGALTSWNPLGHSRSVMGLLYSAPSRNEHQQCFLWSKGGRCLGLTTCNRPAQGLQDRWSRGTSYTLISKLIN